MELTDITIGMVGAGGDGVVVAGDILASSAAADGLHCMMVKIFGPQIRGGESSCRVRISSGKVNSQGSDLDVLVSFSWVDYQKFSGELDVEDNVVILMDEKENSCRDRLPIKGGRFRRVISIPFSQIAADTNNPRGKNMVMLGVLAELFGLPECGLRNAIGKKFGEKAPEVTDINIRTLEAGIEYVKKADIDDVPRFTYKKTKHRLLLTGDEAVAFGALASGCEFYSSYPITPASEIMEWLVKELPKFGGVVVQAEDEISAMCMVLGASYGGVRAMTATSGPGLSLKTEAIGLGIMAELPCVVVDVQRGGPSTGLPTKFEQADLCSAVYGPHGDAPHAVMAASDVEDCYRATVAAFNIAETYQMPVILLTDQFLGHRKETVRELDVKSFKKAKRLVPRRLDTGGYKRFVDTPDGISPMTWPGIKYGEYTCPGIEHDEYGAPTARHDIHEQMSAKRSRKIEKLAKEFKFIRRYGATSPEVGVIAWGSTKGVVKEAVEFFENKGLPVGAIIPQLLYPLQLDLLNGFMGGLKSLVIVEMSYNSQFERYLRSMLRLPDSVHRLKSSGGKAFTVREVMREIDKAL